MSPEIIDLLNIAFLTFLIVIAIAVSYVRDLLYAAILLGAYSVTMALIWLLMSAPDLAITEAAAGIGMTTLMIAVISRTGREEK
ncbi:MAG: DUF4040 domain-containing protein [Bacillota bacterium]|nr:DUF4040 domain-containing protein [Bacillota bacterium]HHU61060.1 DUF4040 domain-containing protein [Natronincola sp.]